MSMATWEAAWGDYIAALRAEGDGAAQRLKAARIRLRRLDPAFCRAIGV